MNYEKLTVDRFGLNLKEGKYKSITGARRAIGKTSSWGAKEKEAAQALANKHFKVEATPKAAKPSPAKPAVAAKPAAPKVAKKAAVKKAPVAAKVTTRDSEPQEAPSEKQYAKVERTPVSGSTTPPREAIAMGEEVLSFLEKTTKHLIVFKELHPTGDFSKAFSEMDGALTRAVTLIAASIPSTASPMEEALPPPRVSLPNPKPTPVVKPAPKVETKAAPEGPVVSLEAKMSPRSQVENLVMPAPATPNSDLTPEEQAMADSLRNATPVSSFAGLPRPVVTPAD